MLIPRFNRFSVLFSTEGVVTGVVMVCATCCTGLLVDIGIVMGFSFVVFFST